MIELSWQQPRIETRLGFFLLFAVIALVFTSSCGGGSGSREVRIAVASNFKQPASVLVSRFQKTTESNITVTVASTGKIYAQIENGAPFDVFLAADSEAPIKLENENLAASGTRFTYAVGTLVLWSPRKEFVDPEGKVLEGGEFEKLAIANPSLAPYGRAAEEVLKRAGLWDRLQDNIVRGENVGQTYQFVDSGNAEIGFVALSQVKGKGGSYWIVPRRLYSPIEQQAVLLSDDATARGFLAYLKSDEAKKVIRDFGYEVK